MYSRKPVFRPVQWPYLPRGTSVQISGKREFFYFVDILYWGLIRSEITFAGLIIFKPFQTLQKIDRGESLLMPWYAPDHPDSVQPVSDVVDKLAGLHVHILMLASLSHAKNFLFCAKPNPLTLAAQWASWPLFISSFSSSTSPCSAICDCYLILLVPLAPHGYHQQ